VQFRSGKSEDAAAMTNVVRRAKASWGYPAAWLLAWEPDLTLSAGFVGAQPTLVAEMGGEIVGIVALDDPGGIPEVAHLWVAPEVQGRGIGRELLTRALGFAGKRGWRELRIESDPNAVAFYERMGARVVGRVDAPVCGEPRWLPVMRLPVPAGDDAEPPL